MPIRTTIDRSYDAGKLDNAAAAAIADMDNGLFWGGE